MPGCTSSCRIASNGPRWRPSRPTMSGSHSYPLRLDTDRTGLADIRHGNGPSQDAADSKTSTRSDRQTTPYSTTSSGSTSPTSPPATTGSNDYALCCERSTTTAQSSPVRVDRQGTPGPGGRSSICRRSTDRPKISSGRATSNSSSTSSARWCNRTSIDSPAPSPGSSRSARPPTSRCADCGRMPRTSPRSISLRSRGPSGDGRWDRAWPRITRFEDRWRWLSMSVVPRFRKFDANSHVIDASLQRIVDDARVYASTPCLLPRASQNDNPQTRRGRGRLTLSWLGLN